MAKPSKRAVEEIGQWLGDFQIVLSKEEVGRIWIFLDELIFWNNKMNLTGLRSKARIVNELLLDSLLPAAVMPEAGRFLDIGSGAGFPAIPLKILRPSLTTHLVEPKKKKGSFLRHVIRLLGLDKVEVIEGRIQDQAGILDSEGYDLITSRALSRLSRLIPWCEPHLRHGGLMVIFQGTAHATRHSEDEKTLLRHHMSPFRSIPYTLPGKSVQRELRVLEKRGAPVQPG